MNSQKLKDGAMLTRPRPVFSPGRLVSAVVVLILAAMLVHGLVSNEKFRWDQVATYIFHGAARHHVDADFDRSFHAYRGDPRGDYGDYAPIP